MIISDLVKWRGGLNGALGCPAPRNKMLLLPDPSPILCGLYNAVLRVGECS